MRILPNKKGQFYVFISIMLITYVLTISPPQTAPKKPVPVFAQLHKNYIFEAPKAINSAIYDEANLTERFMNFSDDFLSYSKTREPKFGMIYLLAHSDGLDVKNYLSEAANISVGTTSFSLNTNNWQTTSRAGNVSIYLGDIEYTVSFTEPIQLKALFKSVSGQDIKVYVHD